MSLFYLINPGSYLKMLTNKNRLKKTNIKYEDCIFILLLSIKVCSFIKK